MRGIVVSVLLSVAVLLPKEGTAQVYQFRTPPPPVLAQYADWQFNDEPILVNSLILYPTRETRFFDGEIMSQVGVFRGVPVYADVTLEPWSVVYVPVGRLMMRGYERRRAGEIAGTQGSRMPAFPVDVPSTLTPEPPPVIDPFRGASVPPPVMPMSSPSGDVIALTNVPRPVAMRIESIPAPRSSAGIWLEYAGQRWYADGPATVFDPNRFVRIGEYRGFTVYRDRNRGAEEIWVRVVPDGPVAPYTRR
jgi:hypothetical protein